ncbi:hypothetical protein HFP51_06235 [Parasphingopyxis sp. CP4]|uniref:hypothetical protein n=1 Tax=Parasphingopyxis sp. CP4 TaxID=2724527 RepID=UPI0015A376FC|nr:hypothetical protein [Parasphingopyxis sp. CP4]QLC21809.1 hypothetical protein HFP51_06235 [Parasphingopyxis sp. CP4]
MADTLRFSPSAGWDEVRQMLGSNMQLLIAIAGVFFLLPGLVLSFTMPAITDMSSLDAIVAVVQPYLPLIILASVIQMAGQLAIWTLVMAADRPTVGEAIKAAILFLPFYFLINILTNIIVGAGILLFIVPGIYLAVRLAPIGVIAITEGIRNPFTAIQRSFAVTRSNALPIFAFLLIVVVVFLLISLAVSLVFTTVFAMVGMDVTPAGTGGSLLAVISGIVGAAGTTVFTLMAVTIYRQLTGSGTPEVFS